MDFVSLLLLIITPLSLVVAALYLILQSSTQMEFLYENSPKLIVLYTKALYRGLRHKQGSFSSEMEGEVLADGKTKVVMHKCGIERSRLEQYAAICAYEKSHVLKELPLCFLEIYFLPLLITLTLSPEFKLSPLGLIHIKQRIERKGDLQTLIDEPFNAVCTVKDYRNTKKGIEVDVLLQIINAKEICIWEGLTTLLSRNERTQRSGDHQRKDMPSVNANKSADSPRKIIDSVELISPNNIGLRYARVSGDWNPHHLSPLTSRFLGYKRHIAHGMWSVSRCLAWLQQTGKYESDTLLSLDVEFKRPIYLPGISVMTCNSTSTEDRTSQVEFEVHDSATGVPQLIGKLTKVKS